VDEQSGESSKEEVTDRRRNRRVRNRETGMMLTKRHRVDLWHQKTIDQSINQFY